ncbi:MAG: glycoside hydrolase family 16 protein [Bacteroidota bacterium]
MKRLIFIFFIANIANAQTPLNDPHWQLLWQDDFNTIDPVKWVKAHYGDHFGEPILMLEQNVDVNGGNLVIKVDNNPTNCPINPPPNPSNACGSCAPGIHPYTGGWVENTNSFNIQYGYIEAMIKFPMGTGLWLAFWTYFGTGVIENNPAEIDIGKIIGDLSTSDRTYLQGLPDDNILTTNIHTEYDQNPNDDYEPPDYFSENRVIGKC